MKSPEMGVGTPEQNSFEFRKGDEVKLTREKMNQLGKLLEDLPTMKGVVSVIFEDKISVDFGGKVIIVKANEIELY